MKNLKSKFIAVFAAAILTVGSFASPAQADYPPMGSEWWIGYNNIHCNGEGIIIYNYAVLVVLWGYGEVQSFRTFRFGKIRHCEYKLPYRNLSGAELMEFIAQYWEVVDYPLYAFLVGYLVLPRPKWADAVFKKVSGAISREG